MQLIKYTIDFSHLAVHAPDGLLCAPFDNKDPLVISSYPHCYVTGNMDEFKQENYNGIQIIQAPKFTDSPHNVVLLNRRELTSRVIKLQS
mmetsp:Transcript_13779/g.2208  ORF Transcript_13779/g.2208 Transcript_13779/m.2208 type:complete len:90 (+) Transcript_13779:795-1064(+)